jgi:uncharacterized protein YukE
MDVFVKFGNLEQSLGRFKDNAQQYMDCIAGLQQIAQSFEGGGFMGECGTMFNDLLNRDMSIIQEFADIFEQCASLLGETISEFGNGDSEMQSKMPD